MSSGVGFPHVTDVMPDVGFPADLGTATGQATFPDATPLETGHHVGVPHGVHLHDAAQHFLHQAAGEAHHLIAPAVSVLGSLSGALLVARATMASTQFLAEAALRAGEHQRELRAQRLAADRNAACWHDAVCAAARLNARITVLGSHLRRTGADPDRPGPDAPPAPPLPPTIDPAGKSLTEVWQQLAETGSALRRAEAHYARSALRVPPGTATVMEPAVADLHERLRTQRRGAIKAYERAVNDQAAAHTTSPGRADALTAEEVTQQGAELLAALPLTLRAAEHRSVEDKVVAAVEVAAERPRTAARYLRQARKEAERMWEQAARRETAATQLGFLTAPHDGVPLPDASAEIDALRAFLDDDRPLSADVMRSIKARVEERHHVFQQMYTAHALTTALQTAHEAAVVRRYTTEHGTHVTDWWPPGWDSERWLRISVAPTGAVRVSTQHEPRTPEEDTFEAQLLDWQRCTEAEHHVKAVRQHIGAAGLDLHIEFEETPPRPVAPTGGGRRRSDDRTRARRSGEE